MMDKFRFGWEFQHLSEMRLEEKIRLRARLELERMGIQESTPIGEIYVRTIPELIIQFVLNENYPFDYLRSLKYRPYKYGSYHVYVLHLDAPAYDEYPYSSFKDGGDEDICVYVGETGKSVADRIADHASGWKTKGYITRNMIESLPLLYEIYNPLPSRDESRKCEAALAEALHRVGCTVFGGH